MLKTCIKPLNEQPVKTLQEFRNAVLAGAHQQHFVVRAIDNISCTTDKFLVVLSVEKILQEEFKLSQAYHYQISPLVEQLLKQ